MATMTYLVDIDLEGCQELLASAALGRLGVIVDGRPEVYPVNHVFDRETGCVAFPSRVDRKHRAALNWPSVAFEVDGVSEDGDSAWSVLVVGPAEPITDPDVIERLARARRPLWVGGPTVQWLRIVPERITGRRISAAANC
jgi:hypothetical protein